MNIGKDFIKIRGSVDSFLPLDHLPIQRKWCSIRGIRGAKPSSKVRVGGGTENDGNTFTKLLGPGSVIL